MPFPQPVKELAYQLDPGCWEPYSGRSRFIKRLIECRRNAALKTALETLIAPPEPIMPQPERHALLKISMMLHFAASKKPFSPEAVRTSAAYTRHVKRLLSDGLIERPSRQERRDHPGWSYRTTDRGRAYVEALRRVGLPECVRIDVATTWAIPRS